MKSKRCPGCNQDKPSFAFSVARSRPDGLQSYCRECMAERWRKYTERNRKRFAAENERA